MAVGKNPSPDNSTPESEVAFCRYNRVGDLLMIDEPERAQTARVEISEVDRTYAVPSFFCNKMYLTVTPVTGRLTFAETHSTTEPRMRTSVTLAIHDLLALRDLISQMLEGKTGPLPTVEARDVPDAG